MSLYKSLLNVQSEMGAIAKDSKNPFFKSSYLSLNGLREAVIPVLTKHKVLLVQPTIYLDGKAFVATRVIDSESGEFLEGITEVVVKTASDAQQAGSGISYARRYGLMSLLCLAADDDDGNSASGKSYTKEVVKEPIKVAASSGVSLADINASAKDLASMTVGETPKKKVSFSKKSLTTAAKPVTVDVSAEDVL